jgi:Flp pilus assembly protein TadD
MALAVMAQPGPYHRAWSLYLLDHDREVAHVLQKVRQELVTRRDVYGYDLLAWALHKSGRDAEALVPMRRALSLGTRDAMLHYHAGVIELADGDSSAAQASLGRALAINPFWHPTQPAAARALLDSLPR